MIVHSCDEKRKFIRVLPEVCLGDREEIVALIARMSPTDSDLDRLAGSWLREITSS